MRIRSIKPDFFKDDELAALDPLTRLAFIGLWCVADGHGRMEDKPARLKVEVLPYDDADMETILKNLEAGGWIIRYSIEGKALIQIRTFGENQRITGKEATLPSKWPGPDGKQSGNIGEAPSCPGREGKGKERKGVGATEVAPPPVVSLSHPPPATSDPERVRRHGLLAILKKHRCLLKIGREDVFHEWDALTMKLPLEVIDKIFRESTAPLEMPSKLRKHMDDHAGQIDFWRLTAESRARAKPPTPQETAP